MSCLKTRMKRIFYKDIKSLPTEDDLPCDDGAAFRLLELSALTLMSGLRCRDDRRVKKPIYCVKTPIYWVKTPYVLS